MASGKTPEGQWDYLQFSVQDNPKRGIHTYFLAKTDIHVGENISWYKSWHFDIEQEEPCPVAPIIVEAMDEYSLVLRYREQTYRLSMKEGERSSIDLEKDHPVQPTHAWTRMELREPFTFTLTLTIERRGRIYGSTVRKGYDEPPVFDPKTGRVVGVKTMQEVDHDAWEDAANYQRTGTLPPDMQ